MGRRAVVSAALVAALAAGQAGGCRSAASVVLDLPPAPPPSAAASAPVAIASSPQAAPAPPPIERMHDRDSVLAALPRDSGGRVDWVAAARTGVVRPRPDLPGRVSHATAGPSGFDFFFKADDPEFDTSFPHSAHGLWMDCRGCHPTVYRYRGTRTDMEAIDTGDSCGACHRTVAFDPGACYRCHPGVNPRRKVAADLGEDLVFARDSAVADALYPPARFSHWVHRIRYQCTACHPDEFALRAGATTLTMAAMKQGRSCGACHDARTAFGIAECARCHIGRGSTSPPGGPGG